MSSTVGDKDGQRVMTVIATVGPLPERQQEISYTNLKVIGSGSFGVVYQAKLVETNEPVAIKKVLQDKRFKVSGSILTLCFSSLSFPLQNRELQIMRRLDHCNILRLQYFFYSAGDKVSHMTLT